MRLNNLFAEYVEKPVFELEKVPEDFSGHELFNLLEDLRQKGLMSAKRTHDVFSCGNGEVVGVLINKVSGNVRSVLKRCHSRFCPVCHKKIVAGYRKRLSVFVRASSNWKFLTIGYKNATLEEYGKEYYQDCQKSFNRLKQYLKRGVKKTDIIKELERVDSEREKQGKMRVWDVFVERLESSYPVGSTISFNLNNYVAVMETKYSEGSWNVHHHILYDGDFIPQPVISFLLKRITKGKSYYSYIKACNSTDPIRSRGRALSYITKYLGKFETPKNSPEIMLNFASASFHNRMITFYGVNKLLMLKQKMFCYYGLSDEWEFRFKPSKNNPDGEISIAWMEYQNAIFEAQDKFKQLYGFVPDGKVFFLNEIGLSKEEENFLLEAYYSGRRTELCGLT